MGICVHIDDCDFLLKRANEEKALQAARQLKGKFRWGAEPQNCWDLREVFETFGFSIQRDPGTGDITDIDWETDKMGDERKLFEALAPFIETGSYITWGGDYTFRWEFDDGKMVEKEPKWE